jgi:hypothetical protein
MELVYQLVGDVTGTSGVTTAILVGVLLALALCAATVFFQWIVGR